VAIPVISLPKDTTEVVSYLFDFSNFPEVVAGETLSSPSVSSSPSGLTVGTPAVTAAERDGVAAGEGVAVTVSGGTASTTYSLECSVTTSGGSVRVVKGEIVAE
jgi:hypothetical protein